jgi:hypothetical protein
MRRATPIASVPQQQVGKNHSEESLPTHGSPPPSQSLHDHTHSTILSLHDQAPGGISLSQYPVSTTSWA